MVQWEKLVKKRILYRPRRHGVPDCPLEEDIASVQSAPAVALHLEAQAHEVCWLRLSSHKWSHDS